MALLGAGGDPFITGGSTSGGGSSDGETKKKNKDDEEEDHAEQYRSRAGYGHGFKNKILADTEKQKKKNRNKQKQQEKEAHDAKEHRSRTGYSQRFRNKILANTQKQKEKNSDPHPKPDKKRKNEKQKKTSGGVFSGLQHAWNDATPNDVQDVEEGIADVTGVTEYANSESGQKQFEKAANADNWWEGFDTAVQTGVDFTFDHPDLSIQDSLRTGIKGAYGLATGDEHVTDEEIGQTAADTAGGVQDVWNAHTGDDNIVWDGAGWLTNALVADPAKAATRATTGIDIDSGNTEGTVGAFDLADIGFTVAGLGTGQKVAESLGESIIGDSITHADEGASLVSNVIGKTDDVAGATEDAAKATEDALDSVTPDDVLDINGNSLLQTSEETTTRVGDDVTGALEDGVTATENVAEETTNTAKNFVDDLTETVTTNSTKVGETISDGSSRIAENASKLIPDLVTNPKVLAGGAATVAGGAVIDLLHSQDRVEIKDDATGETYVISKAKNYQPTQTHPNGGTAWQVVQNGQSKGYTVITGITPSGHLIILGADGSQRTASVTESQFKAAITGGQE